MNFFRLAELLRERGPRNWSNNGPVGPDSAGKLGNWANPRTSCNSFNMFILVAIRSIGNQYCKSRAMADMRKRAYIRRGVIYRA